VCFNCQVSILLATSSNFVIERMTVIKIKFNNKIESFQRIRFKVKNILNIKTNKIF